MTQELMMPKPGSIPRWADGLWLALLSIYIVAGAAIVPFHGDEATLFYMGRDYHYLFVEGDLSKVVYNLRWPEERPELHLRMMNGSISKMAYGWVMAGNGRALSDYNTLWDWGEDYQENRERGKIPHAELLRQARLTSALQLALAAALFFKFVRMVLDEPTAYLASALFALHPSVLINGRRAMMEGSHLLGLMLVLLAGAWLLRERNWRAYLLLGVCTGFAVASKHPNALPAGLIFLVCAAAPLSQLAQNKFRQWRAAAKNLAGLLWAGILSLLVFVFLNPGWWRYPVEAAQLAIDLRSRLFDKQLASRSAYESAAEQAQGFFDFVFAGAFQYFEVAEWATFDVIADQISNYESSGLAGLFIGGSGLLGVFCLALAALGAFHIARSPKVRACDHALLLVWMAGSALVALVVTPLAWARYYLPLVPALVILVSVAIVAFARANQRMMRSMRKIKQSPDCSATEPD